jgi:hypothetical protein
LATYSILSWEQKWAWQATLSIFEPKQAANAFAPDFRRQRMPKKLLSCVLFVMLFAYAHAGWSQDRGYLIQDATVIPELGTGYNSATLTPLTETCIDWDAKINDTSVDYGAPATSGVQRLDESSDIAATLDLSYRSIFTALKSSESVEADINSRLHV